MPPSRAWAFERWGGGGSRQSQCSMPFFIYYQYIMSKLNDMKFIRKVCEVIKLLGGHPHLYQSGETT